MYSPSIQKAAKLLTEDEIVAIPTETVYGLAGNAYKAPVIKKIFTLKNRPLYNPLIVHAPSIEEVQKLTKNWPDKAFILAKHYWPGPLTLLLEKKDIVPDLVTASLPTVAVRIPNHPVTLALLNNIAFPLAAPSANPFSYISPTSAEHVREQFKYTISYILDGGPCSFGLESTIIGFQKDKVVVYRLGAIATEEIEKLVGPVEIAQCKLLKGEKVVHKIPGTLSKHYAPHTPLIIGNIPELIKKHKNKVIGLISFQKDYKIPEPHYQIILSPRGNLLQAARNFFNALRSLDKLKVDIIITSYLAPKGIGNTMNERLTKAAYKF